MTCPWCDPTNGCLNKNEEKCDFKTLPMEADAIKQRMDEEREKVVAMLKEDPKDMADVLHAKSQMKDKMEGINIMKNIYETKFGKHYEVPNQLEFTKALIDFMIKCKKLERASQ